MFAGNAKEIRQPNRAASDRAAIDDSTPVVQQGLALALCGAYHRRMRLSGRLKAADALIHVPAEGADNSDVIVVPHVPVGHDVEAGRLLVAHYGRNSVVVRLLVRN